MQLRSCKSLIAVTLIAALGALDTAVGARLYDAISDREMSHAPVDGADQFQSLIASLIGDSADSAIDVNQDGKIDVLDFQTALYEASRPESQSQDEDSSKQQLPVAAAVSPFRVVKMLPCAVVHENCETRVDARTGAHQLEVVFPGDSVALSRTTNLPHAPPLNA